MDQRGAERSGKLVIDVYEIYAEEHEAIITVVCLMNAKMLELEGLSSTGLGNFRSKKRAFT